MKIRFLLYSITLLVACEGNVYEQDSNYISVEGFIEQGKSPIISLIHSLPVCSQYESIDSITNYFINNAIVKITVDNIVYDLVVVNTGRNDYPFIYTSYDLLGEEGKTYSLDIIYEGKHLSAISTIPKPIHLLSIMPAQLENDSESYMLIANFIDDRSTKDYYKTFVSSSFDTSNTFLSSFMGNYDDLDFTTDTIKIAVLKGRNIHNDHFTPFFKKGESAIVKFCHIDKDAYLYWNEYEKAMTSSRNPIFSYRSNLPSNINGGLGYWWGYGSTYYKTIIE